MRSRPPATRPRTPRCEAMASALEQRLGEVIEANGRDMAAGAENGLSAALLDRLKLDEARVRGIAADVRKIAALPDPVGEVLEGWRLENGLEMRKVRVPLGVVAVVYEARPNVTIDCSALCLKSGNAIVLRGSSMATHSNAVLAEIAASAVESAGLPRGGRLAGRRRRPRRARRAGDPGRRRRPDHPARGRGAEGGAAGRRNRPGDLRRRRQLPRLRRRHAAPRRRAERSSSTPRSSGPESATRPRPCSSTPTRAPSSCRASLGELREAGVELRADARTRALAGDARRLAARRRRGGLGDRVPGADPRGQGRRLARRGDRPRQPLQLGPLRGDRHRLDRGRRALHARRRRGLRLRQRLDPLHRRRRVRDGRRDRQLDPEAARRAARSACAS